MKGLNTFWVDICPSAKSVQILTYENCIIFTQARKDIIQIPFLTKKVISNQNNQRNKYFERIALLLYVFFFFFCSFFEAK